MSSIVNPIIGIGVASYSIVKGIKMFIGGARYLTKKEGDTKWESVGVYNCFYHPTNEFILLNKSFSVKRDVLQGKEMYTFYDKKCSNCNCAIADYKKKRTSRDLPEFCPKCGKMICYKLG